MIIRVMLPAHLRTLAHVDGEIELEVEGEATQRSVLDALERRYPALRGTLRDHFTQKRRPFVRFFACEQDLSHEAPDAPLPAAVARAAEPFLVVGAIAGGSGMGLTGSGTSKPAGAHESGFRISKPTPKRVAVVPIISKPHDV